MKVLDSLIDLKETNPYVHWIHLWETCGDPHIPPFPQDLIPSVASTSSLDEITPPDALVALTNPVPATDALDSMQQVPLCLPTLPSCDDFLLALVGLFLESHIKDMGDILNDINLLFEANNSFIFTVTDSCILA